jgi:hypothetical protein
LVPLDAGQLIEITTAELRSMSKDDLLRRLVELGYSIEGIETETQAMTTLISNAYSAESLEDLSE